VTVASVLDKSHIINCIMLSPMQVWLVHTKEENVCPTGALMEGSWKLMHDLEDPEFKALVAKCKLDSEPASSTIIFSIFTVNGSFLTTGLV